MKGDNNGRSVGFANRIARIANTTSDTVNNAPVKPTLNKPKHPTLISAGTWLGTALAAVVGWSLLGISQPNPFDLSAQIDKAAPNLSKLEECMQSERIQKELAARDFANPGLAARLLCN